MIAKDNGDSTYDINYDDGEAESSVGEALIRLLAEPEPEPGKEAAAAGKFSAGDKIQAR